MSKNTAVSPARLRPDMVKRRSQVMLWPDHQKELVKLGGGSLSAGVALLVARHLKKPLRQYGRCGV